MWPRELGSACHKKEASVDKEIEENRTSHKWAIHKKEKKLLINIRKMSNLTSKERRAGKT